VVREHVSGEPGRLHGDGLNMEVTERERAKVIRAMRDGVQAPRGPFIEDFDARALADALESEATRSKLLFDNPKVDLRMDADDAVLLARLLRHHVTQ